MQFQSSGIYVSLPQLLLYIALYYFVLLCITLSFFKAHCILSLMNPICPKPLQCHYMYHAIIACAFEAWVGICHALITCSSAACDI